MKAGAEMIDVQTDNQTQYLYHYYDRRTGPFRNLSDLSPVDANTMLERIRRERPGALCAQRDEMYMQKRHENESIVRNGFLRLGGRTERCVPHYMVLGHCPWLLSWYEQPAYIRIPICEFDLSTVSFTYGDSFPTFSPRVNDGREYRRMVYDYEGIMRLVEKYDLPQNWNGDGSHGPERYIEACVWSDETISRYI